jgi:phosphoribosylformimino-5-aminoimidazole carboxamide ribotide isomerase
VNVIVSGGIDSIEDLERARDARLSGVIVGRALFEHRFTIQEALACCSSW